MDKSTQKNKTIQAKMDKLNIDGVTTKYNFHWKIQKLAVIWKKRFTAFLHRVWKTLMCFHVFTIHISKCCEERCIGWNIGCVLQIIHHGWRQLTRRKWGHHSCSGRTGANVFLMTSSTVLKPDLQRGKMVIVHFEPLDVQHFLLRGITGNRCGTRECLHFHSQVAETVHQTHLGFQLVYLNNPAAEASPLCQILKSLCIWVVIFSKLSLHHLHTLEWQRRHICVVNQMASYLF